MNYRLGLLFIVTFMSRQLLAMNPGQIQSERAVIVKATKDLRSGRLLPDEAQALFNDAEQRAMNMKSKGISAPITDLKTAFQEYQNRKLRATAKAAGYETRKAALGARGESIADDIMRQSIPEAKETLDNIQHATFSLAGLLGGEYNINEIVANNYAIPTNTDNKGRVEGLNAALNDGFQSLFRNLEAYRVNNIRPDVQAAVSELVRTMRTQMSDLMRYVGGQAKQGQSILKPFQERFVAKFNEIEMLAKRKGIA